jgi:hypothetical protein
MVMKNPLLAAALCAAVPAGAVEQVQTAAEVVKVDKLARTLTIRDAGGETAKILVPPEVHDLERVGPGAELRVRYARADAVAIGKTGAAPAAEDEIAAEPANAAPGAGAAGERLVVGRVEAVDAVRRELKVEGPEGETITIHADPGVSGFEGVRAGDTVAVRFVAATALVVAPR